MNQYNQRKEPTFGEPSQATSDKVENVGAASAEKQLEQNEKLTVSLHSTVSPGHTFTPTLKRPADGSQKLPSLEEQAMLNQENDQKTPEVSQSKHQNGGFAFAPVKETRHEAEKPAVSEDIVDDKAAMPKSDEATNSTIERVIPVAMAPTAKAVVEKVPSKYRRLLIVVLLLLAIILVISLLKPKTPDVVENLQQQGSSLPIEFRPVDEEEAKRAEAEAKALQEAQAQQQASQEQTTSSMEMEQTVQPTVNANTQIPDVVEPKSQIQEQPVVPKPVVQEPVKKPETTASVIYQPETAKPVVTKPTPAPSQTKPQAKAEVAKPQMRGEAKPASKAESKKEVPVVTAEPVKIMTTPASSKTMVVPKGVSLMQVFRDHNLNISDVNAMNKVNGIVSNLKAGEKVTVRLDKEHRVIEMTIGSGGRFIRQANGTYIYK